MDDDALLDVTVGFVEVDDEDGEAVANIGVVEGQSARLAAALREVADMLDMRSGALH